MAAGFIPNHGNYRELLSYRKAEIVYDITHRFCERFLSPRDRTVDQMVQAARSGKQNIAEGAVASGTSKETEIKLLNVARASLEELLCDYRDFLRVRDLPIWEKDSKEALLVRRLGGARPPTDAEAERSHGSYRTSRSYETYDLYREFVETRPPETVANIAICLIHQANFLLDRQLKSLEQEFLKEGGIRERMTKARLESRRSPPRE